MKDLFPDSLGKKKRGCALYTAKQGPFISGRTGNKICHDDIII